MKHLYQPENKGMSKLDIVAKYIAEYYFLLKGNVDAIVFTAGVGENNSYVRREVVNYISNIINVMYKCICCYKCKLKFKN